MTILFPGRADGPAGGTFATCAVLWLAVAPTACGGSGARPEPDAMSSQSIEEVLAAHTDSLMALPGVVGTAIGVCNGAPCIRVFLSDSSAATRAHIPEQLGGYPVRTEVTGGFRARPGDG